MLIIIDKVLLMPLTSLFIDNSRQHCVTHDWLKGGAEGEGQVQMK